MRCAPQRLAGTPLRCQPLPRAHCERPHSTGASLSHSPFVAGHCSTTLHTSTALDGVETVFGAVAMSLRMMRQRRVTPEVGRSSTGAHAT